MISMRYVIIHVYCLSVVAYSDKILALAPVFFLHVWQETSASVKSVVRGVMMEKKFVWVGVDYKWFNGRQLSWKILFSYKTTPERYFIDKT